MPRVNGIMQPIPGAYGVPDTPIESNKYNSQLDDLVADANNARPVTAGGIGSQTAVGGADNLSTTGSDIASASTTNLAAATGVNITITGTTAITGFGTAPVGAKRWITFAGALTLTYDATKLILPGAANIVTVAGDTCVALSLGSGNWRVVNYQRITGKAITAPAATDLLAAIKTVDGAGSGLDADLLDGQQGSFYTDAENLTGTFGGAFNGTTITASGASILTGGAKIGSTAAVSDARLVVIAAGNDIEFGHTNSAGYRSTLGADVGNGSPFLAFSAEAGSTNNTYRTRGIRGSIIKGDGTGGFNFVTTVSASADNQSPTTLANLSGAGIFEGQGNIKANGNLYATGDVYSLGGYVYAGDAYLEEDTGNVYGTQWTGGNLSTYITTTFQSKAGMSSYETTSHASSTYLPISSFATYQAATTAGAIGAYIIARPSSSSSIAFNATVAGSSLTMTTTDAGFNSGTPSGSYRCMTATQTTRPTLFLRYA